MWPGLGSEPLRWEEPQPVGIIMKCLPPIIIGWSLPIIMECSPPIGSVVMKRSPEALSGAAEAGATATATIRATIVINNRMRFFMRYLLIRKGGVISPA